MIATLIVGALFFAVIGYGIYQSLKNMKNNSCIGCDRACSGRECGRFKQ